MKKDRIAFVVQRYGEEVNGGAEYECRVLAEHLTGRYDVSVYTSCAKSIWDNDYSEGTTVINGVTVYRFRVEKEQVHDRLAELITEMNRGNAQAEEEWTKENGPFCPQLIERLSKEAEEYKTVIFYGYLFYPTIKGLQLGLKRVILIPTAHDEPAIYFPACSKTILAANAFLYNSIEERQFLFDVFHTEDKSSRLTCVGIDIPCLLNDSIPKGYEQYQNYIVYAGRVCSGKGYDLLNQYFIRYKQKNPSNLKLLVMGRIGDGEKIEYHKDIVYTGFVTEEDKIRFMKNARLLVMPSKYESLSLVILESMSLGVPVLVNGNCAVLKGQCIRSNAGLYYTNYAEFEKTLDYMLENKEAYREMARNGLKFVKDNYNWDFVVDNVSSLIEEVGTDKETGEED